MNVRSVCPSCSAPVRDAFVCTDCLDELSEKLGKVRGLAEDLEVSLCRQAKIGSDGAGIRVRSAETPLMFNWAASLALSELLLQLSGWVVHLADVNEITVDLGPAPRVMDPRDPARVFAPRSRAAALAGWLNEHLGLIAVHPEAGLILGQIVQVYTHAEHVIDRPAERRYAGPCGEKTEDGVCEADLYAPARKRWMTCPACGIEHDMDARREELLTAARDQLLTATEASRALPGLLGQEVTASMIRGHAHRGALTAHPPHPTSRPASNGQRPALYRLGDVVEVLLAAAAEAARKAKKGTPRAC